MAKKKQTAASPPGSHFATVRELVAFMGIGEQGIRKCYLPELDASDVQQGKPMRYRSQAVLEILIQRRAEKLAGEVDPMAAGDSSDQLERWRGIRADMAALELAEKRGQLIDRVKSRDILARWASIIRKSGEVLGAQYGNDAAEEINDALNECGIVVETQLGDPK